MEPLAPVSGSLGSPECLKMNFEFVPTRSTVKGVGGSKAFWDPRCLKICTWVLPLITSSVVIRVLLLLALLSGRPSVSQRRPKGNASAQSRQAMPSTQLLLYFDSFVHFTYPYGGVRRGFIR